MAGGQVAHLLVGRHRGRGAVLGVTRGRDGGCPAPLLLLLLLGRHLHNPLLSGHRHHRTSAVGQHLLGGLT